MAKFNANRQIEAKHRLSTVLQNPEAAIDYDGYNRDFRIIGVELPLSIGAVDKFLGLMRPYLNKASIGEHKWISAVVNTLPSRKMHLAVNLSAAALANRDYMTADSALQYAAPLYTDKELYEAHEIILGTLFDDELLS